MHQKIWETSVKAEADTTSLKAKILPSYFASNIQEPSELLHHMSVVPHLKSQNKKSKMIIDNFDQVRL